DISRQAKFFLPGRRRKYRGNMKHEARNSKSETNSNDKNPKFETFWSFDPAALGSDEYPPLAG
ncbi:unnamed protein product, partial [marine sediment metagenome]